MRTQASSIQHSWLSWSRHLSPGCCVTIVTTSPASSRMSSVWQTSLTAMEAVMTCPGLTCGCGRTAVKVQDSFMTVLLTTLLFSSTRLNWPWYDEVLYDRLVWPVDLVDVSLAHLLEYCISCTGVWHIRAMWRFRIVTLFYFLYKSSD